MAKEKKRAAFFTPLELDILIRSYGEFEHVFKKKKATPLQVPNRGRRHGRTLRLGSMRAITRGRSAPGCSLRWKYKNIVQTDFYSANRKKADARKTGGGRAPPPLTEAEALALRQNFGRPATEGIPGGSSSSEPTPQDTSAFITYSDGAICLVEPPHATTDLVTDEECEETLSAAFTEGEPERPVEGMAGKQQEGPSTSTAQIDTLPVKDIYKIFLLK
ncbi:uncharacterized protein LOC117819178 [Notolabrus celidotus]|uniref:uncharacterized protein LOC117819178 n=1 Tax=Notolabrus celidotus TaxID=1203425 RepID=UPI00149028F3|nr:uncharacterized protein LOC117819178 [Notolabrus celidotus]